MFCISCGTKAQDGARFCHKCGNEFEYQKNENIDKKFDIEDKKIVRGEFSQEDKKSFLQKRKKYSFWGMFLLVTPFLSLIAIIFAYSIVAFVTANTPSSTQMPLSAYVQSERQRGIPDYQIITSLKGKPANLDAYFNLLENEGYDTKEIVDDMLQIQRRVETPLSSAGSNSVAVNVIKTVLGLLALFSVIGVFIGVPVGIILLNKSKNLPMLDEYDKRSGFGGQSIIPTEIQRWNWGAAGFPIIWGLSQGVWISLLSFIPILNWFFWIYLGINGNELAWRARKWESVETFLVSQKKWNIVGIIFFVLNIFFWIMIFVGSID